MRHDARRPNGTSLRILAAMEAQPERGWMAVELADQLGLSHKNVSALCAYLAEKGAVVRRDAVNTVFRTYIHYLPGSAPAGGVARLHDVRLHIKGTYKHNGRAPSELAGSSDRGPARGREPHKGPPIVTILPSAPVYARHQHIPGTPVEGCGFAALGMGRYVAPAESLAAKAVE